MKGSFIQASRDLHDAITEFTYSTLAGIKKHQVAFAAWMLGGAIAAIAIEHLLRGMP